MAQSDSIQLPFFVGSINKPGPWFHPSGEGVSLYELDRLSGSIRHIEAFPEVENAVWLALWNQELFAATERFFGVGEICSLDFDGKKKLTPSGPPQSSMGGAVCHIVHHPVKPVLFVSSFLGGVTVHSINKKREIAPSHQEIFYQGNGPHIMQDTSHPHQATVAPDGKYLLICDLGSDTIWVHDIYGTGDVIRLGTGKAIEVEAGSGPRHLIFHPELSILYLLGQLNAQVYVYAYKEGTLRLLAVHRSLQEDLHGKAEGAAIKLHPSAKALYISDRYSNTITTFSVGDEGNLERISSFSTRGKVPRDFLVSPGGDWMIVLNQDSDTMAPFHLNAADGMPDGITGDLFTVGCPVCGLFWP